VSATQEFTTPDINEDDYYKRLGAPPSAEAGDIDNHTKKYVTEFKPELSTHDNADERWNRFNNAWETLKSADSKEDYDTFRERFGAEQAAEAYETWQANDALGDPDSVSARDLGLEAEVDESESRERSRDRDRNNRRSSSRQRRSTREERRRERAERRQAGETDIDTDSSKTYSTRSTDEDERTAGGADTEKQDQAESDSGAVSRVIDRVRLTVDLAAAEVSTVLSLLDVVVAGYLLYVLLVEFVLGSVPIPVVRDAGTVVISIAVIGVLSWEHLDRFSDRLATGETTSVSNQFARSDNPARLLALPTLFAVLWTVVLLVGGAALTILLLGVSVVSLYGRLRGVESVVDLPDWADYVELVGGILAAIVFVALFVLSGQAPGGAGPLAGAEAPVLAGVGVALLALVGAPIVAAGRQVTG